MALIGIISDIHGNLPALNAVLAALVADGVDRIVCCGDLVGYGPWPGEVIACMREADIISVQGNHDAATAEALPRDWFDHDTGSVIEWTRAIIPGAMVAYLKGLPQTVTEERFTLVHGSLRGPLWEYVRNTFTAGENFALLSSSLCLFGHTHLQGGFVRMEGRIASLNPAHKALDLLPQAQYLINPGSVGQPRDGDPRAAYAIIDLQHGWVRFGRVTYDIDLVMREIKRAGLPSRFADRLARGR